MPRETQEIETFRATTCSIDSASGIASLRYALDDAYEFEERIDFGGPLHLSAEQHVGFQGLLRLLHLAAGVSYYKIAAPRRIQVETGGLTDEEIAFCLNLYTHGLREFRVHNALPLDAFIELRSMGPAIDHGALPSAPPQPGICVPVGGGKDSIVVVEALRAMSPVLLSVGGHPAALRTAEISGLPMIVVRRHIDPLLFELNASGALNGHVPITAIVSLISVASGYVHGFDTTFMSLEGSADEPTRTVDGLSVNHQWSKTSAFEHDLAAVLRSSVHEKVTCLSVLRGFSELQIASAFALLSEYHHAFRSCNRAFSLRSPIDGWCGNCSKCRFVFLTLALYIGRGVLVDIFGRDLLDDPAQVEGFRDLLEEDRKPFECVGTRKESLICLRRLMDNTSWREAAVLQSLRPIVLSTSPEVDLQPDFYGDDVIDAVRREALSMVDAR